MCFFQRGQVDNKRFYLQAAQIYNGLIVVAMMQTEICRVNPRNSGVIFLLCCQPHKDVVRDRYIRMQK
ncbi:MAG: hypothetical protein RL682_2258 [Pseudomonadota bacterium]|jgi:hypothetical protein